MVKSPAGSTPLAYSSPEAVQTTGTVAVGRSGDRFRSRAGEELVEHIRGANTRRSRSLRPDGRSGLWLWIARQNSISELVTFTLAVLFEDIDPGLVCAGARTRVDWCRLTSPNGPGPYKDGRSTALAARAIGSQSEQQAG